MTEPTAPIEHQHQQHQTEQRPANPDADSFTTSLILPRIAIRYCTQCKWMLRAAYFAQELLSTFNTSLGEVSLIPSTGGIFTVTVFHASPNNITTQQTVIWDRKVNGGFPDTKVLKSLVRNIVDPSRELGHTDRALKKDAAGSASSETNVQSTQHGSQDHHAPVGSASNSGKQGEACEDCQ